jgi:hypothetical protein
MGHALRQAGKPTVLDWRFEATDLVHTDLHGKSPEKGAFTDAENRVSNALRYFDKTSAPDFEADLEENCVLDAGAGLRECASAWADRAGLRRVQ